MTPFFHWLPKPLRVSLLLRFNLGNHRRAHNVDGAVRAIESTRLLDERNDEGLVSRHDHFERTSVVADEITDSNAERG